MISGVATVPSAITYLGNAASSLPLVRVDGTAQDRVRRFRASASVSAFRLGGYLAMTEPWLPV